MRTAITALFSLSLAVAQQPLSSPVLGFAVLDQRLLQLTGLPGAASLSPVSDALPYQRLFRTPLSPVLLLAPSDRADAVVYRAGQGSRTIVLDGPLETAALSPSAEYFATLTNSRVTVYRAPATLVSATPLDELAITAAGASLAVGDAGEVLIATPRGFWLSSGKAAAFLSEPTLLRFPCFLPRSQRALAYNPDASAVLSVDPTHGSSIEVHLAPYAVSGVTALVLGDSTTVWLSHSGAAPLIRYSVRTREVTTHAIRAGIVEPLGTPGLLLWATPTGVPALLDTTRSAPILLTLPLTEVSE